MIPSNAAPAGWGYDGFRRLGLRPSHSANRKTPGEVLHKPVQPLTSHSSLVAHPAAQPAILLLRNRTVRPDS